MKKILVIVMAFVLILTLGGCITRPRDNFTPEYSLDYLQQGAFRGGSMVYVEGESFLNQINLENIIPFKLTGYEEEDDELAPYSEKYGYITVDHINMEEIALDYVLYNEHGRPSRNQEQILLKTGTGYDIDSDGLIDITYTASLTNDRDLNISEGTTFLNFISSYEEKRSAMFRNLCPVDHSVPNIVAINNSGKLLLYIPSGSLLGGAVALSESGDFVIMNDSQEIWELGSAPAVDGYLPSDTSTTTLDEALNLFEVKINGNISNGDDNEYFYPDELNFNFIDMNIPSTTFNVYNGSSVTLGFHVRVNLILDADFSVNWKRVKGSIKAVVSYRIEGDTSATLSGTFYKNLEKKIYEKSRTFTIDGVPVNVSLPVYLGISCTNYGTTTGNFSAGIGGHTGGKASFKVTTYLWGTGGHLDTDNSLTPFISNAELTSSSMASIKPYVRIEPKITMASVVSPRLNIKGGIKAYAYGPNKPPSPFYKFWNPQYSKIVYGFIDADFALKIGYKCLSKTWNWDLWDYSKKIYSAPFEE